MANLNEIILECMENIALRKRFLSNPYSVFFEKQYPVPSDVKITAVQSEPNHIYITIPEASCASHLETSRTHPRSKALVIKCLQDEGFKSRLMRNPKTVFETYFGLRLTENTQVHVHCMDELNWVFVFPPMFLPGLASTRFGSS